MSDQSIMKVIVSCSPTLGFAEEMPWMDQKVGLENLMEYDFIQLLT